MKIGVLSQIRNERDIIPLFLSHLDSIFDVVYLIDHRSVDGTEVVLQKASESNKNWKYFKLDFSGHFQSQIMTFFMHEILKEGIDFLFFLDADEFIKIKDRQALETLLNAQEIKDIPFTLNRINSVPHDMHQEELIRSSKIWVHNEPTDISKVVVSKELYLASNKNMIISQGNHSVFSDDKVIKDTKLIGSLYHFPVRSLSQVQKKYIIKSMAYLAISDRDKRHGFHNFKILDLIANGELTDGLLRGVVGLYEKDKREIMDLSSTNLKKSEFKETTIDDLEISFSETSFCDESISAIDDLRIIADSVNTWDVEEIFDENGFILENNVLKLRHDIDMYDTASLDCDLNTRLSIRSDQINRLITKLEKNLSKQAFIISKTTDEIKNIQNRIK